MKNTQSLKLNRDFRRAYKGDNFVGGYTVVYMKKNKKFQKEQLLSEGYEIIEEIYND
uniref:hypothetical protein n=1 Tax=Blautia stercoris TaxID=871664 RepID=UPI004025D662